jgi:hypothetical protein
VFKTVFCAVQGPHFWDECPFPANGACQAGPTGDFQAYINLFNRAADLIRTRPDAITGERSMGCTHHTFVYTPGMRQWTHTSAKRAKAAWQTCHVRLQCTLCALMARTPAHLISGHLEQRLHARCSMAGVCNNSKHVLYPCLQARPAATRSLQPTAST